MLSYPFVDLDDWIEQDTKISIREIFEQKGELHFRELERNTLHKTAELKKAVIACGGGTPCFFDNIDWMNRNGLAVYLHADTEILTERLIGEMEKRPLLRDKNRETLLSYIEAKLAERSPFYEKANVIYYQKTGTENAAKELHTTLINIIGH